MSTRPAALSATELKRHLKELKDWSLKDGKLFKMFVFKDFSESMGFMVRAISFVEIHNHHPEWLNVYNRVEVSLITHDVKGSKTAALTKLDVDLAKHLDTLGG